MQRTSVQAAQLLQAHAQGVAHVPGALTSAQRDLAAALALRAGARRAQLLAAEEAELGLVHLRSNVQIVARLPNAEKGPAISGSP